MNYHFGVINHSLDVHGVDFNENLELVSILLKGCKVGIVVLVGRGMTSVTKSEKALYHDDKFACLLDLVNHDDFKDEPRLQELKLCIIGYF